MPAPVSLRIAQPCPEGWDAMLPTGPGRHCTACQKTVVDFTQQTDAEILTYFQQAGAGKTCERFRPMQLGRPLTTSQLAARPQRWQLWLAGLLVAALTTQSCQPSSLGEAVPHTRQLPRPASTQLPAPPSNSTRLLGDTVLVATPAAAPACLSNQVLDTTSTLEIIDRISPR